MVGREVVLRVNKGAGVAGRSRSRRERPARGRRTSASRRCAASRSRSERARSSRSPASTDNGQTSSSTRSPGCGRSRAGRSQSATSDLKGRLTPRDDDRGGNRPHPRRPSPARAHARVQPRREPCPTRLRQAARLEARLAVSVAACRAGGTTDQGVRRSRRGPLHVCALPSGGNQQKVVLAREVARDPIVLIAAQPTRGLDVGAIEFVHRRLIAERDARPRDPARLARARGGALALRPHPRHVRGADRRGVRGGRRERSSASRCSAVERRRLSRRLDGGTIDAAVRPRRGRRPPCRGRSGSARS